MYREYRFSVAREGTCTARGHFSIVKWKCKTGVRGDIIGIWKERVLQDNQNLRARANRYNVNKGI